MSGGAAAERQIKTLVYMVDDRVTLLLLRGDHELNEVKLAEATGSARFRPAGPEECRAALGALPGSLGAVGVAGLPVFADEALRGRREMTTGANENVPPATRGCVARPAARSRSAQRAPARLHACGSRSRRKTIDRPHLQAGSALEPMGARVLTAGGVEVPIVMGSYGLGIERIMAAAIEAHHDANGIVWPRSIAPFDVVVSTVKASDPEQREKSEQLYAELGEAGLDVLLDDRDERPGVKSRTDLVGIPFRTSRPARPRRLRRARGARRVDARGRTRSRRSPPRLRR
jgi:prolyl-tRNA synthetase